MPLKAAFLPRHLHTLLTLLALSPAEPGCAGA